MFTLRPTARLLRRLRVPLKMQPPETTTRLGDWYANLLYVGRQQLVLALSEKTLLPVVIPAAPHATLGPRLRVAVAEVLGVLAIRSEAVERELAAMADVAYGKTTNRQVLGVMVDLAKGLPFYLDRDGSLLHVTMTLAGTPCGPLYKTTITPDRTTIALFKEPALRLVHSLTTPSGSRAPRA